MHNTNSSDLLFLFILRLKSILYWKISIFRPMLLIKIFIFIGIFVAVGLSILDMLDSTTVHRKLNRAPKIPQIFLSYFESDIESSFHSKNDLKKKVQKICSKTLKTIWNFYNFVSIENLAKENYPFKLPFKHITMPELTILTSVHIPSTHASYTKYYKRFNVYVFA